MKGNFPHYLSSKPRQNRFFRPKRNKIMVPMSSSKINKTKFRIRPKRNKMKFRIISNRNKIDQHKPILVSITEINQISAFRRNFGYWLIFRPKFRFFGQNEIYRSVNWYRFYETKSWCSFWFENKTILKFFQTKRKLQ